MTPDPLALSTMTLFVAPKHMFHGFEIDALARHFRRLLILLIDLVEPRRLAGRLGHRLQAIAFRLLQNGRRLAARGRDDIVGIGLRFIAHAVCILLRRDHVAEGGDDLLGRLDRLQLDLQDENAGLVAVEDLLHQGLHFRLDHLAAGGQDLLDLAAADDLAHGALGDRLHRLALIGDVEGIIFRMGRIDLPDHHEFDVGDILVARQHQALFRQIELDECAGIAEIRAQHEADIGRVAIGHRELLDRADRKRQIVVEAGCRLARIAAEDHVQADFIRTDRVKSRQEPEEDADERERKKAAPADAAAGQPLPEPVLSAAQPIFEIGPLRIRRLSPRAGAAGAPRTAIPAAICRQFLPSLLQGMPSSLPQTAARPIESSFIEQFPRCGKRNRSTAAAGLAHAPRLMKSTKEKAASSPFCG